MSRSARAAAGAGVLAAALVALPQSAAAEEYVPEQAGTEVDSAPVHDLTLPAQDLAGGVDDLTLSTSTEDGSMTDSENAEERIVTLDADVLFAFDEAELSDDARKTLEDTAEILRDDAPSKTVSIDGYTDSKGEESYNRSLSEDRAAAVEQELSSLLDGADITFETAGHGSADPVAPNEVDGEDNPDGRAENRRVEVAFAR
ncbi:OmpA family protein [Streptomonospora salina]|uniref:Outer membrane protein OmpA-like peptidoglycan-associated protein n=1 Tax=Streptomonospora salina TaxID=104205 RepID=A0A841EBC9_9ACTN|nr:OmpA family protein [Streptomonospora salina]MBB5998639.1 outer membrane protein OmpA-like peptidoglycan-associated protein [Streptomonospora salina]